MGRWALDVAFVWKAVLTLGLVLLYYCFSIGITFYNKWLTKSFHFPLFMTMLHLAVIFLFSALSRALVQCSSHRARVVLSWADYLRRVAPTALATALDVGLSNWSFLYVTVSLYTMTKSSAVLFILIFSLIFKLEELTPELAATAPHPTSARHWSWWSSSSPGVSSCSPTSPHSSTWRALPWCWGPHSSVAFAGPSPRCSCRRLNLASRIPSTPCSTCSHSCSWGSSLSLLYLKVSICPHLRKSSVSRTQGCSCGYLGASSLAGFSPLVWASLSSSWSPEPPASLSPLLAFLRKSALCCWQLICWAIRSAS
ncbi:solute carrier family 35 member C2 isoform X3 [Macaca nemestrina]|uniref:solute carrier family 35 member C2 isoform X3 n=1 Tax=Macaca nemestrina TaxID=9545 RepID=UPI000732AD4B|nr:solute carrier family 35 member C2 isoform X6 [Macaca mulatta]XP_015285389.1 solute carrier family 35 member C2 isoform X5 [Macaca fascicularis]